MISLTELFIYDNNIAPLNRQGVCATMFVDIPK